MVKMKFLKESYDPDKKFSLNDFRTKQFYREVWELTPKWSQNSLKLSGRIIMFSTLYAIFFYIFLKSFSAILEKKGFETMIMAMGTLLIVINLRFNLGGKK